MKSLSRSFLFILALAAPLCILTSHHATASDAKDPVVGRWKTIQTSCVLVLSADGKAHQYKVNFSLRGKWECIDDKSLTRKYRVNWENGLHVYEWRLEKDGNKLHGKDGKVIADRIKE